MNLTRSVALATCKVAVALGFVGLTSCVTNHQTTQTLEFEAVKGRPASGRVDADAVFAMPSGGTLELKLPGANAQRLILEWVYTSDLGRTWIGHLAGNPDAKSFISISGDRMYGTVDLGDSELQIQGSQDQLSYLRGAYTRSIGSASGMSDGLFTPASLRASPQLRDLPAAASSPSISDDQPVNVRVALIATLQLRAAYGWDRLPVRMQNIRARTVEAFKASNTLINIVFSAGQDVNEPDGDLSAALDSIIPRMGPSNPIMQSLQMRKWDEIADIVVLLTRFHGGPFCGMAHVGGQRDSEDQPVRELANEAQWAYAIVNVDDAGCRDDLTTAHEIGHTMGAMHDRATDSDKIYVGVTNASWGFVGSNFSTVMSYPPDDAHKRIGIFSSPFLKTCNGQSCGACLKNCPQTANADTFRAFRSQIARWHAYWDLRVATRIGQGRVVSSYPDGTDGGFQKLNCPPDCFTTIPPDRHAITLTAIPGEGYKFAAWENIGCSNDFPTCVVQSTRAIPVAVFVKK